MPKSQGGAVRFWLSDYACCGDVAQNYKVPRRPLRWINRSIHAHYWLKKPIAYLIGTQPFGGLSFLVKPPILIPRWETAEWLENVSKNFIFPRITFSSKVRIYDLYTGSGCLGLSLIAKFLNHFHSIVNIIRVDLIDIDPKALNLASKNIDVIQRQLNADSLHLKVQTRHMDLLSLSANTSAQHFSSDAGTIEIWIGNPPYIPTTLLKTLPLSVAKWENRLALDGLSSDGLFHHRNIISYLAQKKRHHQWILALEMDGDHQRTPLESFIESLDFGHLCQLDFLKDSAGITRTAVLAHLV